MQTAMHVSLAIGKIRNVTNVYILHIFPLKFAIGCYVFIFFEFLKIDSHQLKKNKVGWLGFYELKLL